MKISRLFDLFGRSRPSLYASLGRENGLEWIKLFYYYAFKVGGHKELARLLAPPVTELLTDLLPASDAIEPAVRVAEWSVRNAHADRASFCSDLKQAFDKSNPGSKDHLLLGLAFALLLGRNADRHHMTLARDLLKLYESKTSSQLGASAFQAALIPILSEILQNLGVIVDNIRRYREQTLSTSGDGILVEYDSLAASPRSTPWCSVCYVVGEANAAAILIAAGRDSTMARPETTSYLYFRMKQVVCFIHVRAWFTEPKPSTEEKPIDS